MSFPNIDCDLRTDSSFRQELDSDHHKETTILTQLPIDLIEDFPIADSLHLLDLGLMKRLLSAWVMGSFNYRTKFSSFIIQNVCKLLAKADKRRPSEIHRSVRSLETLKFWKGIEFRTILLYVGPVIFKNILPEDVYIHFLMLSCATIICSCKEYLGWVHIANQLFRDFVKGFYRIYGRDTVSSNVHNLCHVADDVKKFGSLVSFSAYPFENYLYQIKQLVRGGRLPLSQIAKRITEISLLNVHTFSHTEVIYPHTSGSKRTFQGDYLKISLADGFVLTSENKNRWFLTKKQEIVGMNYAKYINGTFFINGDSLNRADNFFEKPFCSSRLNIFTSNESEKNTSKFYKIDDVKCKLFAIDFNNDTVFMPLLHTLEIKLK